MRPGKLQRREKEGTDMTSPSPHMHTFSTYVCGALNISRYMLVDRRAAVCATHLLDTNAFLIQQASHDVHTRESDRRLTDIFARCQHDHRRHLPSPLCRMIGAPSGKNKHEITDMPR